MRKKKLNNINVTTKFISSERYKHKDKLLPKFESPIEASTLKRNKDDGHIENDKLQQNTKNGFIEGRKVVVELFPLISAVSIICIVMVQMHYAKIAEHYYNIEKSLFFTENVYGTLIDIGLFAIFNLLFPLWLVYIYFFEKKFSLFFGVSLLLICVFIFCVGLSVMLQSIIQGIYPKEVNKITYFILNYPQIFIPLLSLMGTMGFWIMLDNTVVSHPVQKKRIEDGNKETAVQETGCSKSKKVSSSNSSENEFGKSKMIKSITAFICFICVLVAFAVIGVWVCNFILGGILIINKESYPKKKTYEIVQNNKYPESTDTSGQTTSASNIQVVILHRGSQVLLMNGVIDGNETINPQEDMSSSNLVIDTSFYEFQEESQYRFYKKKFKNVTTTELLKEQQNKKTQESP
jgi:hypothetical protein